MEGWQRERGWVGVGVGVAQWARCALLLLLLFVSVKQLIIIGPKNPFSLYVKCARVLRSTSLSLSLYLRVCVCV